MHLYFWQNIPSPHQVPYQRELVRMGHRVTLCANRLMLPERARMGWQPEDTTGMTVRVGLPWAESARVIHESEPDSVHLITGVRGVANGGRLTRLAHALGRRVCWVSEAWDPRGVIGKFRSWFYQAESVYYRRKIEKIFAMGARGVADYQRAGYSLDQVCEFNYVVPYAARNRSAARADAPFVFGYVGALIPRKRVDLLLSALATLRDSGADWFLEIHGDGPELPRLRSLAAQLGLETRVRWAGAFSSVEAPERMARLDALVLPSDFDGWGAVVNEALLCGVPVVISDGCGAACLPARHGWGRVFRAGDALACADACSVVMAQPPVVDSQAVDDLIGPAATAERMLQALGVAV